MNFVGNFLFLSIRRFLIHTKTKIKSVSKSALLIPIEIQAVCYIFLSPIHFEEFDRLEATSILQTLLIIVRLKRQVF